MHKGSSCGDFVRSLFSFWYTRYRWVSMVVAVYCCNSGRLRGSWSVTRCSFPVTLVMWPCLSYLRPVRCVPVPPESFSHPPLRARSWPHGRFNCVLYRLRISFYLWTDSSKKPRFRGDDSQVEYSLVKATV